ncbi:substrate-binding domain-containing protein [Nocardia yamanashiensis]|uniref:sugar ABC transporter substrate-binding protein n=1 Tax=Nocardia yamanashiensis TaxID=209247 RepID=UPI001E3836DC|nr:substrate-binding domain-containing protein [Nocardia yamanashiensis]UGT43333.1 substrate-binding domain-containing protein [Nocardia yamanashiensis]
MHARFRRALIPFALITTVAALATGCGRGADSEAGGFKIAIVTRNFTNPYWAALRDGALAEGDKRGVKVVVQAGQSETDADGENAQISTMAAQGYDCFGVVPVNGTNVITPLSAVARKNIPILNLDTQIDPKASAAAGVSYASFIGSDNLDAGRIAGQKMLEGLGGSGKVAILQGIAGEQNGINRDQGFTETVAGKLEIVQKAPADYEQDKGLQVTEAILRAHPDITGIFAANDTMGLGAAQAIKNAGKSGQIKVISVDGIQAALEAVKSGSLYGTVTQYPYAEGQLAVQSCLARQQGKELPARVVAPIAFIGKDNVEQQISAFPRPIVTFDNPIEGLLTK